MKNKAVFFDRDGVLNFSEIKNRKPYPPKNADNLIIVENAKELLNELKNQKFLLICITNQPDFSRGTRTLQNIQQSNDKVSKTLNLDDLFCCLHDNKDNCSCRKPKPGMIFEAEKKWNIDLTKSFLIGDRKSDIEAGISANLKTIFIDYDYDEEKPNKYDFKCSNLQQAVSFILNEKEKNKNV
jgi:D-glycero-D-manno-heptose 1,7-bisphosphate phosphatase